MPYAVYDRDAFVTRTGLGPDMKVLNIGQDHITASQVAKSVEKAVAVAVLDTGQAQGIRSTSTNKVNPVVTKYSNLPFKDNSFDIIFSYHAVNYIQPGEVPGLLGEANRTLKENGRFASMIWSQKPTNKAQLSHLMLLGILEKMGVLYLHKFDEISRWLEGAGFEEITMELVSRNITVPDNWVRTHLKWPERGMVKYSGKKVTLSPDIDKAIEDYKLHVKEHGEELLPSIQFTARRSAVLPGIDIL
ncbi:MAG TPA: methyltransferase domain-containing protein [Methanosarcinales archaeon]|nr:methyltransferase domain-containing protein [Methanosarcinales archaeon]